MLRVLWQHYVKMRVCAMVYNGLQSSFIINCNSLICIQRKLIIFYDTNNYKIFNGPYKLYVCMSPKGQFNQPHSNYSELAS